jgi:hypothetical protein
MKVASALHDINKIVVYRSDQNSRYTSQIVVFLTKLREELGNPYPIVYPLAAYSQAFAANGTMQVTVEAADFSTWSVAKKFKFNKETDLLIYKMICGNEVASLDKTQIGSIDMLAPQYDPPALLKQNPDRTSFCSQLITTNSLYSTPIAGKKLHEYFLENMNYDLIGDYQTTDKIKTSLFDNWWTQFARNSINGEFKKFDERFKELFQISYDNFFDHRSYFKFTMDWYLNRSKYLPPSLSASLKFETNFYLQILNRSLVEKNVKVPERYFNYLEFAKLNSEDAQFKSIYDGAALEVVQINNLLNDYQNLIRNPNMKFETYIAHSKKIDTAINMALVKLNLKKLVSSDKKNTSTDDIENFNTANTETPTAASTGSENTDLQFEDVKTTNLTYKQKVAITAIQGLKTVEAEIRRFIRMRIALSHGLTLDHEEFMNDWNNGQKTTPKKQGASPRGT